jgi:hypothetical protein
VWVVSCVLYSQAITALEFLLMSYDLILLFCLGTGKTLSVCLGRGVLAVIKFIYLPLTYRHFMQDIEYRWLLLTSSMSSIDLPFQEHRMTKKHHINQNSYIFSLCLKPGVVSDNMTQGDDVAKSSGPTDPSWGWPGPLLGQPARVWHQ